MSPTKAVIYCRVSSRGQEEEGHGLDSQETRCRQYAAAKQYDVAAVFPDTITGGGDVLKRKGMVALLAFLDAQPHENFVVIFDDLKRYARDVEFHLKLRREMAARGAMPECLNFNFVDTPEGKFSEIIVAASGQLEREQNSRQVSQTMRARMESGYWVNNAPAGYRYEVVKGHGKMLVPDEPLASIVREAYEGYASGRFETQAEVMRFLEGFPNFPRNKQGRVIHQRVVNLLTQPVYTGHICSDCYDIHWLKAQHEPIVSLEVYDKVQERRAGVVKAPNRANIGDAFVLRGIVTCASCNVPFRPSFSRGKLGKRYPYYLCQTNTCEHYGKSIRRDQIEGEVGELIKVLQPTEGLMTLATAMFRHIWTARQDQTQENLRAGKREIAALAKEIDKLLDTITTVSKPVVIQRCEEKIDMLQREKTKLAEKMASQAKPKASFEEKLEPVLTFLANPWKLWETGNINLRRLVLKLAFADRIRYDRFEGARTPEIAFPFKALTSSEGRECLNGGA